MPTQVGAPSTASKVIKGGSQTNRVLVGRCYRTNQLPESTSLFHRLNLQTQATSTQHMNLLLDIDLVLVPGKFSYLAAYTEFSFQNTSDIL